MIARREFLAGVLAAPAAFAGNRINTSRLSAITDEIGTTPEESIRFAKKYGLRWVELRDVPGIKKPYYNLPDEELRRAAREFSDNGLKVSFLNTPFLKFTLPGTEPVRRRPETPEQQQRRLAREADLFENRLKYLEKAFGAAEIFGVDKLRVFTFLRTAQPESTFPKVAEIIGEMGQVAAKRGMRLLVENESSCNVATCVELAGFMKLLPARNLGINWDPHNGESQKEIAYPDGYHLLPRKRIENVQIKGKSLLDPNEKLDWAAIFRALEKDGYRGKVGLETHYFDGTVIEKSNLSIQEMLRLVQQPS
jgi:L-ribulose-5-phosphate 3-epimerase